MAGWFDRMLARLLRKRPVQGLIVLFLAFLQVGILFLAFLRNPFTFFSRLTPHNRDRVAKLLLDPKYGTHGYIDSSGVKIHYVSQGVSTKPLILFVHGFPEFWFQWRHQLAALSRDNYCVAIDMRGYGDSDKPAHVSQYQRKIVVEDFRQVIAKLGHKSCILVAHDWGGIIACDFAVKHADMVKKLILVNTAYYPTFTKLIFQPKQFSKSWYVLLFQVPFLPEIIMSLNDGKELFNHVFVKSSKNGYSPEDIETLKYALFRPGVLTAALNYYRAGVRFPDKDRTVSKIEVPTLLIWGEEDLFLTQDVAEAIRASASNVKVCFVGIAKNSSKVNLFWLYAAHEKKDVRRHSIYDVGSM